jgi:Tfp pilus assembly protein PilO
MTRTTVLLSALAAILVVALFWLLLWSPRQDELAQISEETDQVLAQQAELEGRLRALQAVREQAPEAEAVLAAGEAVVPRGTALPSAFRQLQLSADEAGLRLISVSPGRPGAVEGGPATLGELPVNVELEGSYFQVVDFLRRIEDPTISPRGLEWANASLSIADYPMLTVSLSGRMYAQLPAPPPAEEPVAEPAPGEDAGPEESDVVDNVSVDAMEDAA